MESHVISLKQQQKSLAARCRKAAKKTLKVRNVLAFPKSCTHWPLLDEQSDDDLKNLMESLLLPAGLPKNSLPLAAVLKLKGNDRKEARKLLCAKETDKCKILRSKLLLGMNCVTRSIEKNEAHCVVLAGDIEPKTLGKHIINICFLKEVPVVVMPSLRKTTKQQLGVACITLGFKKFDNGMEDDHFNPLIERIIAFSADLTQYQEPVSEDCEYNASFSLLEIPVKKENKSKNPQNSKAQDNIYKYRLSKKERAFVPGKVEGEMNPVCIPSKQSLTTESKFKMIPDISQQDFDGTSEVPAVSRKSNIKVEVKHKKKPDFSEQDFVSFDVTSGGPAVTRITNIKAEVKHKRKANNSEQDFLSLDGASSGSQFIPKSVSVTVQELVKEKTEKSAPQRKLPRYRPLIVKTIQSNPDKKRKKEAKGDKTTGKALS